MKTNRSFMFREVVAGVWPSMARVNIPERVTRSIRRNDDLSEILVKLLQFVIFALWGIFYFAAPTPNPETESSVPLVISIYLVITLALLFLATKRRVPALLIYLSIILDMVLLTYLIWSFHLQYGQPASFSLKTVEVMNYFVLIALRAVRFEARYVITAGVAASLCWIWMIHYTTTSTVGDPMITRDYVTYITSNSILIGAEVSKIISMIMVSAILAIAVRRAHSFLVSSITEGSAARDLSRFMADPVAEQIRDADREIEAGEGVRRNAAILYVDIRGFSAMVADLDPSNAMALLSDYQHQIVPIVHRHGGVVDKFMGDGIMITFGASSPDPDYCADAVRCINEILSSRKKWSGPAKAVTINMAAVEGPVIYGAVGDGDRLELTVIGPQVNVAAKLEKYNKVLGTTVLCGSKLYRKALEQGYQPGNRKPRHRTIELDATRSAFEIVTLV